MANLLLERAAHTRPASTGRGALERLFTAMFKGFVYNQIWEDPDVDLEDDEVEPIINGIIDLGELAAQHLGVALDPYPRKPGAAFGEAQFGGNEKRENPFIKLAELAKKPKD